MDVKALQPKLLPTCWRFRSKMPFMRLVAPKQKTNRQQPPDGAAAAKIAISTEAASPCVCSDEAADEGHMFDAVFQRDGYRKEMEMA